MIAHDQASHSRRPSGQDRSGAGRRAKAGFAAGYHDRVAMTEHTMPRPPIAAAPPPAAVTQDDLHAYADGALSPRRAREVAAYLDKNDEAAALVAQIRLTNGLLRAHGKARADAEIPDRLLDGARRLAEALHRRKDPAAG